MRRIEMTPHVSIVILNWNGLKDTIECLESLQKVTYPNYEVTVVDNASEGNDVKVLREKFAGYVHVIENDKNYGFAKGNNIGIRHALQESPGYVLLLNNDTAVDPGFLDELVTAAEADKRIGIVCPVVYWYHQPDQLWFSGKRKVHLFRGTITPDRRMDESQPVVDTEFATGAAMLIRREAIQKIGLLPEYYFFGMEDLDYSLQALRNGFRIAVVAKANVYHKGSQSVGGLAAARIGYSFRGWQIVRRKYLSTAGYLLATVYGLAWAGMQFSTVLFGYVCRGDRRGVFVVLQKTAQAIKGTIQGSFSKVQ